MSVLTELWYGNLKPSEERFISDYEKKLVSLIGRHEAKIKSELNDEMLDVFEKYSDCHNEYTAYVEAQAFEIGFRLAVRMLAEAFQ